MQPRYTPVERPEPGQICRNCLGLDSEQYAEPRLSVFMGERVAAGPGEEAEDRADETTILGVG